MRIFKNKIATFLILQFNNENKQFIAFNIFLQNRYDYINLYL